MLEKNPNNRPTAIELLKESIIMNEIKQLLSKE